ncbi:DUF4139 domain-containing protein [Hymenobacter edaphi]|uniref:DUF4139 domain-containing protein n=1 Tax=Hymenobacter edaphi TaxID=2211146 RepID=UPI001A9CFA80|nr:DUF4139 domain-containing protein [Hymenobacter edaphi]
MPLRSVTVALNQAELEHRGTVTLPAGRSTVWVEGVASSFSDQSLQVETSDNAQLLTVSSEAVRPPAGRTPTDSLSLLDARLRRLDAEVKALEEERNFLLANRTLPAGTQAGWSTELQKGATFLRTRLPDIQTQTETLTARRQQLANRRTLLANGTTGPQRLRVALLLELARPGAVSLTLRYVNTACLWELRPEIRVPESGRKLIVNSFAKVSNGSGLDWTNVQLRLKNEEVEPNVTKPDLTPWAMNFRSSTGGEGRVDKFVVKGNASGKATAAEPSSVYTVPEPVSVSQGNDYLARLAEQTLPARPEYVTIPKLSEKVFLQAKVTGWEGLFLPDEEFGANVYYAGAYVGETEIDPRAFNDSLEISLGHDNLITVGRTKTQDFNGKAALNGQQRTQVTYEINVRNRHAQAVRVRVLDQIPVSQESDLKVKLESSDGAELDEASGKLTWLLALAGGTSKRVRFTFTVEYPKGRTVDFQRPRTIRSPKFR